MMKWNEWNETETQGTQTRKRAETRAETSAEREEGKTKPENKKRPEAGLNPAPSDSDPARFPIELNSPPQLFGFLVSGPAGPHEMNERMDPTK